VIAGGPGLVAVGDASMDASDSWMAAVWTSTDGVTWSRVPPQPEVLGGPDVPQAMFSVATGGPGLVAAGESSQGPAVWTSTDGITWSRVDTTTLHGRDAIETVLRFYAFGRA